MKNVKKYVNEKKLNMYIDKKQSYYFEFYNCKNLIFLFC